MGKLSSTIETIYELFLKGFIVNVGYSGKDSFCVVHCAIEALKRAKAVTPNVGPLFIVTTDTTIDNFEVFSYAKQVHDAVDAYAKTHGLPIQTRIIQPAISSSPMVEYIGRGKLLRVPQNSRGSRDCAVDWKINPMKKHLASLQKQHQTDRIISLSGARSSESQARKANLEKRNESVCVITETDMGKTLAPIMDWALSDVWELIRLIDEGEVDSFGEDVADELRRIYAAGNGGVCDLFSGHSLSAEKACGSRHGCLLCSMVENDTSLENQISVDRKRYGYMQGISELRHFMKNTLNDLEHSRSLIGRETKPGGWIKIGYNQYSLNYRKELLYYVLTLDALERERTEVLGCEPKFELIDYETLLAIQYHWAREGGESSCGEALQAWHKVHNEGLRVSIPKTLKTNNNTLCFEYKGLRYVGGDQFPEYRWLNIESFSDQFCDFCNTDMVGLSPHRTELSLTQCPRIQNNEGAFESIIPFKEGQSFKIIEGNKAGWFVEDTFLDLVELGILEDHVDPTEMLKIMLHCGIVQVKKGSISRLHRETKRAQIVNEITKKGQYFETVLLAHSISQDEYDTIKVMKMTPQNTHQLQMEF